ncbi:GGDEF domain-containing protein [Niveibacterium sp. 24ML]|uniref:GGDEF domain-containing protein n=1 Tax=Niveibacterium sp. 24ML TaxID=2985512 RepID=UPI00226E993F|nr:GGDEF domain-containing protein [Niveibacterium sp. 24ML]MCX9155517.1 GGDEF domain-containing protein [Niveibacterium sp. 24ML]
MLFHEPTMAIMAATIHGVLALALLLTIRRRSELPGGGLFALGMGLVAGALVLLVAAMLLGFAPGFVLFNTLAVMGFVAFLEGVRAFEGGRPRHWLILLLGGIAFAVSAGFSGAGVAESIRVSAVSLILVVVSGAIALRVLEPGTADEQPARLLVLLAALGVGVIFCARIASAWMPGLLETHGAQTRAICYVGVSAMAVLLTLGFVLWSNLRLASQLARLARIDDLTGFANRLSLTECLARQHARAQRNGKSYSLVILNIDRFESIDGGFGTVTGDRVIAEVARRILAEVRADDVCARFTADEFCILLPDSSRGDALHFAERLHRAIGAAPVELADGSIAISASIGVADSEEGLRPHETVRRADLALAAARQQGGNRVVRWLPPIEVPQMSAMGFDSGPLTSFLRSGSGA